VPAQAMPAHSTIREAVGRTQPSAAQNRALGIAITVSSPVLPFQIFVFHRRRQLREHLLGS
jgi:hypothetical protein